MGVVIPLQRIRQASRPSRQLRLVGPGQAVGDALRACLAEVRRDTGAARPISLWRVRRSPNDPPDAA